MSFLTKKIKWWVAALIYLLVAIIIVAIEIQITKW